jgi:hypothetical protein
MPVKLAGLASGDSDMSACVLCAGAGPADADDGPLGPLGAQGGALPRGASRGRRRGQDGRAEVLSPPCPMLRLLPYTLVGTCSTFLLLGSERS